MKHQWNTGRGYDEHGQRMVAEIQDNSMALALDTTGLAKSLTGTKQWIAFSDLSRHISGTIPLGDYVNSDIMDRYTLEKLVMANYDLNNYSGSCGITLTWEETK
jgi:hypothetical protein